MYKNIYTKQTYILVVIGSFFNHKIGIVDKPTSIESKYRLFEECALAYGVCDVQKTVDGQVTRQCDMLQASYTRNANTT